MLLWSGRKSMHQMRDECGPLPALLREDRVIGSAGNGRRPVTHGLQPRLWDMIPAPVHHPAAPYSPF